MGYWYHYAIMFEAVVHFNHRGYRDARGPVCSASVDGQDPQAIREQCLVARKPGHEFCGGAGLGLHDLCGHHLDDLAIVWHRQSAVGDDRARRQYYVPDQYGQSKVRMDYGCAHVLRRGNDHYGGVLSIKNIFWPLTSKLGQVFTGYLDSTLMVIFVTGVVLVLLDSVRRWYLVLNGAPAPQEAFGPPVSATGEIRMGCC